MDREAECCTTMGRGLIQSDPGHGNAAAAVEGECLADSA